MFSFQYFQIFWNKSQENFYTFADSFNDFLGKDGTTKSDEFSDEFQTAFDLRPSSSENYVAIFSSAR